MTTPRPDAWRSWRGFTADRRGVSAIEFAVLLPLMLTMYFGCIEVTDAISADRKVTLVSNTVGEIATQYSSVTATTVSNILSAASAVLTPFPVAQVKVTLTSVVIDPTGKIATVDWSSTLNGTARSGVVTSSIPASLMIASTSVIWGEATYTYKPTIGYVLTGSIPMYNQMFLRPRLSGCVYYASVSSHCSASGATS